MSYIFERITQRLSAKKYNSLWIKRLRPTSEITRKLRLVLEWPSRRSCRIKGTFELGLRSYLRPDAQR